MPRSAFPSLPPYLDFMYGRASLLALDSARPLVPLRGISGDWLDLLLLEVLVGLLLPLPAHGLWWWAGELSDSPEEGEGDTNPGNGVHDDSLRLAWGREGTGAVWAESNPVGYRSDESKH